LQGIDEETTAVRIHQKQARQQHKRQMEQQETQTTATAPRNNEAEGTPTAGTPELMETQ
jgi:hypothetical protein